MMSLIKKFIVVFSALAILLLPVQSLAFDFFGSSCQGDAAKSAVCQDQQKQQANGNTNPIGGNGGLVQRATNLIAVIGGIGAVIIIIIGGINYATSGGSDEKTKAARTMITNAVIGLVLIAVAWLIVSFIIKKVES